MTDEVLVQQAAALQYSNQFGAFESVQRSLKIAALQSDLPPVLALLVPSGQQLC